MYVRTTYATGDPAKLDGVAEAIGTEGRRLLSEEPGYRGMGLFVDRELGKLLVGSWWEDEASLRASDDHLRERRAELIAPFARTVATDSWEAAVVSPPESLGPGAGFRLVRLEFDPADTDRLVETFRDSALPGLRRIPGFAGVSLLVDRAGGRASVGAMYTDREAMAAARGAVAAVREEATSQARVITRSIEEFEVLAARTVRPS
ncbi:antibiotic biosynthesis monooxygenase [Streptomyces sp. NPDC054887]